MFPDQADTPSKKIDYLKLEIRSRTPEPVRFWKEFTTLPIKKIIYKNRGLHPENWGRDGFLCLCDKHLEDFMDPEVDTDAGDTIGYYVCDKKGCSKTATHELFPDLKKRLEEFDPEDTTPMEELDEE